MALDAVRGKFHQAAEMPSPPLAHHSAVRQENTLPAKSLLARVVLAADTYVFNSESLSGHELVFPIRWPEQLYRSAAEYH
jgi:hypothetical protein